MSETAPETRTASSVEEISAETFWTGVITAALFGVAVWALCSPHNYWWDSVCTGMFCAVFFLSFTVYISQLSTAFLRIHHAFLANCSREGP